MYTQQGFPQSSSWSIETIETTSFPWSNISQDFATGLPPSEGKTVILTIVNCFLKMDILLVPSIKEGDSGGSFESCVFNSTALTPHWTKRSYQRFTNCHCTPAPQYPVGQKVWLSIHYLPVWFMVSFPISKVINPTAVLLQLQWTMRVHSIFHIFRMKPVNTVNS